MLRWYQLLPGLIGYTIKVCDTLNFNPISLVPEESSPSLVCSSSMYFKKVIFPLCDYLVKVLHIKSLIVSSEEIPLAQFVA